MLSGVPVQRQDMTNTPWVTALSSLASFGLTCWATH